MTSTLLLGLPACHRPDDVEGLRSSRDSVGKWRVRRFVGQVLIAGEEPDERPTPVRTVVTDRAAQHWIAGLESVEDRSLRRRPLDVEAYLARDLRERAQMRWQDDADHESVCTSTESTGGRSRTIGAQLSPASDDAYTWPPVVPK